MFRYYEEFIFVLGMDRKYEFFFGLFIDLM